MGPHETRKLLYGKENNHSEENSLQNGKTTYLLYQL